MEAAFQTLPETQITTGSPRPRICIATWEFEGLSRNGGIGTAYAAMADALKRNGYEVSVLFLLGYHPTDGNITDVMEHYRTKKGIDLIALPMPHHPRIHAAWASSISYFTYLWLKEHQNSFDIIHFPECQGLGFYSQLAKRQGLAFRKTTFVIGAHGPTFWAKEASHDYIEHLGYLETDYMERMSVAWADVLVSPSQYLLGWMKHNGWELPGATYVTPNIRPAIARVEHPMPDGPRKVHEIVFFGRLELRKGLKLFCDAVDELCADPAAPPFEITFLGKETHIYGRSSFGYLSDRSSRWTVPWHIVSNKFQAGAIEYLRGEGRLAVIASLADNSPNTVLECVSAAVPLLASNVGGIPELIAAEDREKVCFEPRPDVLAGRLRAALIEGGPLARPSVSFADNETRWANWHAGVMQQTKPETSRSDDGDEDFGPPLVSVCFPYNVREKGASATLDSLKRQDYRNLEIILVECGSQSPDRSNTSGAGVEFKGRSVHRISQKSPELGTGRNVAAQQAKGKYLLFLDDHTVLSPSTAISVLVNVAERTRADIVTSALSFCFGPSDGLSGRRLEHSRRPFLGGDVATGAFTNCFGSTNALVRKDAFEAVGGFSPEATSGLDDWEFLAKAALLGQSIETTPDVFLLYREDQGQEDFVHSLMNGIRSARPYSDPNRRVAPSVEPALAKVVKFGQGLKFKRDAEIGSPLSRGEQGPAVTG